MLDRIKDTLPEGMELDGAFLGQIQREIELELSRRDFWFFRKMINPALLEGWFQREIADELQAFYDDLVAGKRPKLVIEAPPQHGKSTTIVDFIAWVSGKNPDTRTIYTSFSERLGVRANISLQRIFDSPTYQAIFPGTVIPSKNAVTISAQKLRNREIIEFVNRLGYFRNTTVEGSITGESLDLGVIDDPLRGRKDANSATKRESTWSWFTDDFFTRFSEHGAMLAILTRWHIDDPIGRLVNVDQDVRVLKYRAIAETDEPNRKAGEPLFPEHKSLDFLLARKAIMPAYSWASLYQQSPVPDGGAIFQNDWLRFYSYGDLPTKFDSMVISCDFTFKGLDDNDYVCMQVWGRKDGNFYLLDNVRRRMGFTDTLKAFIELCKKWPKVKRKIIEDKANGPAVIDMMKRSIPGIVAINPTESKEARAHAVSTFFESGSVYIPRRDMYAWVNDYIYELTTFPGSINDDQVDATTQALNDMFSRSTVMDYFYKKARKTLDEQKKEV